MAYLDPVDERPVATLEVGNLINVRGNLGDGTVLSRDRGVANHDLIGSVPVSYTHLDVYKRQVEDNTKAAWGCSSDGRSKTPGDR